MERVTFIESIIKILNLIASVPFFIEILLLSFILLVVMIFFYFRKSKKGKITSLIIYVVTLFLLPISHFSFFANTLDQIVENYVEILYFPSCYVYMGLLIVTDISVLTKIIKNIKGQEIKWYGMLDIIYFFVFQFLFFMTVRVVVTENIDIFERSQLYSNVSLTSLLQISSYLFWIRIAIKLIVFIINRLSKAGTNISKAEEVNNIVDISVSSKEKNIVQSNFIVPENLEKNNNSSSNNISLLKDLPVSNKMKEKDKTINNSNTNNMDLTSFIMNIDNSKTKTGKLPDTTLIDYSIKQENQLHQNQNTKFSVNNVIKNEGVDLDLNTQEEPEDFFDDFYE